MKDTRTNEKTAAHTVVLDFDGIRTYLGSGVDSLNLLFAPGSYVSNEKDGYVDFPVYVSGVIWQPRRERVITFHEVEVETAEDLHWFARQVFMSSALYPALTGDVMYLGSFPTFWRHLVMERPSNER